MVDYNIVNLEKDLSIAPKNDQERTKMRLLPAAQVDYNIITNNKLDDFYFQNVRLNVDTKKKGDKKPYLGGKRDFNIISNRYVNDHDNKAEHDVSKVKNELTTKYNRTHDYNPLLAEYYDKNKEAQYQEKRIQEQKEHGKQVLERLPPTIKNRETIIFDPTREVPEAIKVLDQKKKDVMKKYEMRYKIENQIKERDFEHQDKAEQLKMNRINDKKFTGHLDKGFDILTMNDYDKSQMKYTAKQVPTKWEKLRLTSNPSVTQPFVKAHTEKSSLTTYDLRHAGSHESPNARGSRFVDTTGKVTSMPGWKDTMRSGSVLNLEPYGTRNEDNFYQMKDFKTSQQRSKEPIYNLADQYNQYCVPPKRVVDDFNTRTLPQIRVADTNMKFGLTKTGGFKKAEMMTS